MLRVLGHDAALLDGGLLAYDGPLETDTSQRPAATFTARPWPADRLATIDDAADSANVVIDARQRERFRGDEEAIDPRAGHIPGARSVPARENVDANGRFLPVERLRANLSAAGVVPGADVVSYCGSGVTACHNLLAMEHAGLGGSRIYAPSWSGYISDPERPIAKAEE
jgi:thiosulfate/3-mercaptopyruvate sulfurtransferase